MSNTNYENSPTPQQLAALGAAADGFAGTEEHTLEAAARFELGRHLFQLGRGDAAFTQLCRAAEIFQTAGALPLAAQAMLGCAHALTIQNKHEESLEWFDKAIEHFRRAQYPAGVIEASAGRLEALGDLRRWDDMKRSSEIIAATSNHDDSELLVFRLVALRYQMMAHLEKRNLEGALDPAAQAADVAVRVGDRKAETVTRLMLATNLRMLKRYPEAAKEYERVLALAQGMPDAGDLEAQALDGLGAVLRG